MMAVQFLNCQNYASDSYGWSFTFIIGLRSLKEQLQLLSRL